MFLWKTLHNTHKVGDYWKNILNWEHRSVCNQCNDNTTDNLEHIMLSCKVTGQEQIWWLVREVQEKRNPDTWQRMNNIGSITRCAFTNFKTKDGKPKPGDNCLYKILIAESATLIWHLRNQRICKITSEDSWPSKEEVRIKWITRINMRLTIDHTVTQ